MILNKDIRQQSLWHAHLPCQRDAFEDSAIAPIAYDSRPANRQDWAVTPTQAWTRRPQIAALSPDSKQAAQNALRAFNRSTVTLG
ncbi:hypothetical protein [Paraburkholderia hospita]|uniref:hypothetical protein n=1 Tax=Paraburkholderia hospita TaxID=169430 RepID=UPI00126011CB|nr:hypothetical protein [Paraburkholderia hospita]